VIMLVRARLRFGVRHPPALRADEITARAGEHIVIAERAAIAAAAADRVRLADDVEAAIGIGVGAQIDRRDRKNDGEVARSHGERSVQLASYGAPPVEPIVKCCTVTNCSAPDVRASLAARFNSPRERRQELRLRSERSPCPHGCCDPGPPPMRAPARGWLR